MDIFTLKGSAKDRDLVVDAYCENRNYQEEVPAGIESETGGNVPNPESREEFAKRCILEIIHGEISANDTFKHDKKRKKVQKDSKEKSKGLSIV